VQSHHVTLAANVVTRVALSSPVDVVEVVEVVGTDEAYCAVAFGVEPPDPAVAGDNTFALPALEGFVFRVRSTSPTTPIVKLISIGGPKVAVIARPQGEWQV
jgi:hypothetical protein